MSRFQKVCLVRVHHEGKSTVRVYELPTLTVGRSTDAHIGIADPGVSRLHLEISLKHGRLWVSDLGSANGTFINGTRIEPKIKISYAEGEMIQLGQNKIGLQVELLEKALDLKEIEGADIDPAEKGNLMALVQAAHAEAQRINQLVKEQTEQAIVVAENKCSRIESQANMKADDIIIAANNEAQRLKEDAQRRHADTVMAAEADAQKAAGEIFRKGEQSVIEGETRARELIANAEKQATEIQRRADAEAQNLRQQTRNALQELRGAWEQERDRLMSDNQRIIDQRNEEARERSLEIIDNAEKQKMLILEEAQRLFELNKSAEKQLHETQRKADLDAQNLRQQTRQAIQEMRTTWDQERERLMDEAQNLIEQRHEESVGRSQAIIENAEKQKMIILEEAQQQFEITKKEAEEKSVEYYRQAELELKAVQKKSQEIIIEAHQQGTKIKDDVAADAEDLKTQLIEKANRLIRTQKDEFDLNMQRQKDDLAQALAKVHEDLQARQSRLDALNQETQQQQGRLADVKQKAEQVEQQTSERQTSLDEIQQILSVLQRQREESDKVLVTAQQDLKDVQEKRRQAIMESDQVKQWAESFKVKTQNETQDMMEKTRREIENFKANEMQAINEKKLEEIAKLKEFRIEGDIAINRGRSDMINELLRLTEAHLLTMVKSSLPASFDWDPVTNKLQTEVKTALEEMVYKYTGQNDVQRNQQVVDKKVSRLTTRLKWTIASAASIIGILFALPVTREPLLVYFQEHSAGAAAQDFSKKMQTERARRYQPEQKTVWLDSYTDAILYTQGYSSLKLDNQYQDLWIKDLHEYLYGKLRVDEDSIVKLVSLEAALVTKLKEQADQIHPDYVNESVTKMKDMENDTVAQMRQILGDEDKYRKFKKFSEEYYNQYVQRLPASQNRQ